jgi:hypothetical protein
VFHKVAAGHPKFGAEREVRSSTWESSALTASRLGAPRVKTKQKANDFPGRTDWPPTLATHTAISDPGGPAVPPPAPAATVWPQGADPSKAKQSKLSFARASKEQILEQNAARFAEIESGRAPAAGACLPPRQQARCPHHERAGRPPQGRKRV